MNHGRTTTSPPRSSRVSTHKTTPATVAARLTALRAAIADAGLDGFLIPRADAHRGESVPASEARLAYITSFTGSAGIAVVGPKKAALFVDSAATRCRRRPRPTPNSSTSSRPPQGGVDARIGDFVPAGGKLGYDPWLHTPGEITRPRRKARGPGDAGPHAQSRRSHLDRSARRRRQRPVEFLGHNRAGTHRRRQARRPAEDPRRRKGRRRGADAARIDLLAVQHARPRRAQHAVRARLCHRAQDGQADALRRQAKITPDLRNGLKGIAKVADVATLMAALRKLGAADKRVWLDPATAPVAIVARHRRASAKR